MLQHSLHGPGQTIIGINEAMRNLYEDFDPIGIHLVWDGEVDYIEEGDSWYTNPSGNFAAITSHNYHTDGVDIYMGDNFALDGIAQAVGVGGNTAFVISGYTEQGTDDYVFWPQSNIITHEMGHVFFLWETFNTDLVGGIGGPECLDPPFMDGNGVIHNPNYTGDFVYDTPPDPNLGYNNCTYIGGGTDVCGSPYAPLEDNFMSYTASGCMESFSPGQIKIMKNAIWILPNLQSTELQSYTYIRGSSLMCILGSFDIYSNDLSSLVVESSNNISLSIGSPTNGQISLSATNLDPGSDHGGAGWIRVTRSGQELARKDFWVGKPELVLVDAILGPNNINPGDLAEYFVPKKVKGATEYIWDLPGDLGTDYIQTFPFTNDWSKWQYNYLSNYDRTVYTQGGYCSGYVRLYGMNECGEYEGESKYYVETNQNNDCDPPLIAGIVYYPNPADDLLNIDLSLQNYDVFDIVVYSDNQDVVYTDQSTNVVKTINVFNLVNGTYYLHIYQGSELLISKILIINH